MLLAAARRASPHHNARSRGARDPSPAAEVGLVGVPVVLTKDPTDMHLSCVDVETSIAALRT